MANGNSFKTGQFINMADLYRALPNRQPETQAQRNANNMLTGGRPAQSPVKPIQAGAGSVKCPSCGSFHRPGSLCDNTRKSLDKLLELVKSSGAGKEPRVSRVPTKASDGRGNPYHDPSSGQFTSKDGGGSKATAPGKVVANSQDSSTPTNYDIKIPETPKVSGPQDNNTPTDYSIKTPEAPINPNDQATGAYKTPNAEPKADSERKPANGNEVHERAFADAVGRGVPKDKALIEGTSAADNYDREQNGGKGAQTRYAEHVGAPTNPAAEAPVQTNPINPTSPVNTPGHLDNNPNKPLTNTAWMQRNNGGVGLYGPSTAPPSPPSNPGQSVLPGGIPPQQPVQPPKPEQKDKAKPFGGNRMGQQGLANTIVSGFRSGPHIGDAFSPGATFRPTINVPGAGLQTLLKPQPNAEAQKSLDYLDKLNKWRQNQ